MKVLSLLGLLLVITISTFAQVTQEDVSKSTLAIYQGKQICGWKDIDLFFRTDSQWVCEFKSRFICTGVIVLHDDAYLGVTAGHCFDWDEMENLDYYVADRATEHPVLRKINVIKFENDDRYDYGLFSFYSLKEYPVIDIQREGTTPSVGTKVLNVNFSYGVTKQIVEGTVISDQISYDEATRFKDARRRYLVQIPTGPGASGSPVVDIQAGKVVGVVEAIFPGTTMATVVIPMGTNFIDFMDDASAGIKPEPEGPKPEVKKEPPAPIRLTRWQRFVKFIKSIFCFW